MGRIEKQKEKMKNKTIYVSGNIPRFSKFLITDGKHEIQIEAKRKWSFNFSYLYLHTKLQYFEINKSNLILFRIVISRIINNLIYYPKETLFFLFTRFIVDISNEPSLGPEILVQYLEGNKTYNPWVSRVAQLQGIYSQKKDQELEWDMFRYVNIFRCYILASDNLSNVNFNDSNIPVGNLKIKEIDRVITPSIGSAKCITVKNVEVNNLHGVVKNSYYYPVNKFHFLEEVSIPTELLMSYKNRKLIYEYKNYSNKKVDSGVLIPYSNNWYHFLVEGIGPYLNHQKELKNIPVIISNSAPKNISDLLVEITGTKPIHLQIGEVLQIKTLRILQDWRFEERFNFVKRKEDLTLLRAALSRNQGKKGKELNIYFSRQSNLFRKVINIEELKKFLIAKNFIILDPSQLSLSQVTEYMSKARIVISETGAAITNLLMCNQKLKFIELNPENFESEFWRGFTMGLDIEHHVIRMTRNKFNNGSFRVSISKLGKLIDKIQ